MKHNPFIEAATHGAVAAEVAKQEWDEVLAEREKWFIECHAFLDSTVRKRLLLAAEASGQWGYIATVSDVEKVENHTGKIYLKSRLIIELDGHPTYLEFIVAIESRVFTAEAHKKHGRKIFTRIPVESNERDFFIDEFIKDFLKWAVV